MNKLNVAVRALHEVDVLSAKKRKNARVHPLAILLVTIVYVLICASFPKYDLSMLLGMLLYLILTAIWEELSFRRGFRYLKYVYLLLFLLGGANIFFDRRIWLFIGPVPVTMGMLSMLSLWMKGIFMVYASYLMIMRIGIDGVCIALRAVRMPDMMITMILLTYRYIIVLLRESERMWTAYQMRAAGHRGVVKQAWGSFLGLLLLRSMDRGQAVYDSMLLRGYDASQVIEGGNNKVSLGLSCVYVIVWCVIFVVFRTVPVFELVGTLLG